MASKRLNLGENEEEDLISNLPDPIIQHILSFLPSTKEAIRTGVLSKRWQNQWNHVPLLIFDSSSSGMSFPKFLKFIDSTLIFHDCSKIKKFHFHCNYHHKKDPQFASKIRFATRKNVEDLSLSSHSRELLPTFLFNHASLVKLNTFGCTFVPNGRVNWGCLTTLYMDTCKVSEQAIEDILSGSQSLESLQLKHTYSYSSSSDSDSESSKLVISSKSLKVFVLIAHKINRIEISCPNLEKLSLIHINIQDEPELFALMIQNVISQSLLLESFKFQDSCGRFYEIRYLVIASKSLKTLDLGNIETSAATLEISCPHLEQLKLFGCLDFQTVMLLYSSLSLCLTMDVYIPGGELQNRITEDILQLVQQANHVEIGTSFLEVLSKLELKDGPSFPMLNTKCLILSSYDLNEYPHGIARLLHNSPLLEKLIIHVPPYPGLIPLNRRGHEKNYDYIEVLNDSGKNYWNSNASVFNCLVSQLKTIKIIGFPRKNRNRKLVLNFVKFLLKNARVLEKMVVELKDETTYMTKVSQEILSLPRYSRHAIVECCY